MRNLRTKGVLIVPVREGQTGNNTECQTSAAVPWPSGSLFILNCLDVFSKRLLICGLHMYLCCRLHLLLVHSALLAFVSYWVFMDEWTQITLKSQFEIIFFSTTVIMRCSTHQYMKILLGKTPTSQWQLTHKYLTKVRLLLLWKH